MALHSKSFTAAVGAVLLLVPLPLVAMWTNAGSATGVIGPLVLLVGVACWRTWRSSKKVGLKQSGWVGRLELAYPFVCEGGRGVWYLPGRRCSRCPPAWRQPPGPGGRTVRRAFGGQGSKRCPTPRTRGRV